MTSYVWVQAGMVFERPSEWKKASSPALQIVVSIIFLISRRNEADTNILLIISRRLHP